MKSVLQITMLIVTLSILTNQIKAQNNYSAGEYAGNSGSYNTSVGSYAGDVVIGTQNSFFGSSAGQNTTSGYNAFFGASSGYTNTTGNGNSFFGRYSGYYNTTGDYNSFYGYNSGISNTTGTFNVLLGVNTGYYLQSGRNNTFIGGRAGQSNVSGNGNVFIGYSAGLNCLGSNLLYIDNSDTPSPLIWGDFASNILGINGKLGIGKSNPDMELDVNGDINMSGNLYKNGVIVDFGGGSAGVTVWNVSGTDAYCDYNVGIGTSTPKAKLDVAGGAYFQVGEGLQFTGVGDYYGTHLDARVIRMIDQNGTNSSVDGGITFEAYTETDQVSKDVLTIRGSGNVGIGTINPTEKLTVKGTILAEKVQVELIDGADFVFAPDYNLRPLEEVDAFVSENHHLPEIASAEEMEKNGLDMAEFQIQLLQKVEELTLYMIELKKENAEQQELIEQLRSK